MLLLASLLLSLVGCSYAYSNDRIRSVDYQTFEYGPKAPVSHTYRSRAQCMDMCELVCTVTNVFLGAEDTSTIMYNCAKLKPPKPQPFFSTLRGNSFYLTLAVLGIIVVGVLLLLTFCFCCSYCCRQGGGQSRGSSKQALAHDDDGEFKEYLNATEDLGAIKREREFTRRPRAVPQIV